MTSDRAPVKVYRQPDRKELSKICHLGFQPSELFDEEKIADLMAIARRRIISSFYCATEIGRRGRKQSTDNYIIGVAGRQCELARYVTNWMRRDFIETSDLPERFAHFNPKLVRMTIIRAQYELLLGQLNVMTNPVLDEIRYDTGTGLWQIVQSCIDENRMQRQGARKMVKVDQRNEHGRVRSQRRRSGLPTGVSVSMASGSMY